MEQEEPAEHQEPEGPAAAPRLERAVATKRRRTAWRRGTGVAGGTAAITLAIAMGRHKPAVHTPSPPMVVAIVQPAPVPPAPTPPPTPPPSAQAPAPPDVADELACPTIDAAKPSGARLDSDAVRALGEDGPALRVVAARAAARLAILDPAGVVRVSDDGTPAFRAAFVGRRVDELAIDRAGVLYARSATELGIRDLAGHERWRTIAPATCTREACTDRIATLDDQIAWLHDEDVFVSRDRGAAFHRVTRDDAPWASDSSGATFAWRGALYQVQHYEDMCGVDDSPTWRFDPSSGAITHAIFHNQYVLNDRVLEASDEAAATWTWRERCREDESAPLGACTTRDPIRSAMLAAKTLRPVEGGRTLSVFEGSLVELCSGGARQIYRAFPFDHLAAVDHVGRPLVVRGGMLLRWSAGDGWRRLYSAPPE
jgi:hypothetical protein